MNFYKIRCPNCTHRFLWLEHSDKRFSRYLYRRKGFSEQLESTYCPKCNAELAVITDSSEGICIQDPSIEIAETIRGI